MKFSDLVINLQLQTKAFTTSMNNVRKQAQRFSTYLGKISKDGSADELIRGYTTLNDRLHVVGLSLRDIARVSSGIMISQTFYGITRSIREATSALWDFNTELDYAHVTYSSLFADSDLATSFIDTLKSFSVDTIFEYSDIEGMARKLSAYGIEAKNLMYIIEGLTNIGTVSGDSAALERLAVAIGQINAKGTLKAEEMRQLANAYTPIYDILREKLNLTEEQLASVGDLGIKSADAINAIIEYANEKFGDTAEAAVLTIRGLNNKIVDSLKVLGADIMRPVSIFYKSLAKYMADQLGAISEIYAKSGLGGVFEYLVPSKEWQQRIRTLLASVHNLFASLIKAFATLWPYITQFVGGFIDALSLFISVLSSTLSAITGFAHTLQQHNIPVLKILTGALITAASAWLLFKIQALGAAVIGGLKTVFVGVARAVVLLSTALTKHPIVTMLAVLGAVLIAVSANANNANSAIGKLVNSLNSYSGSGTTSDDILEVGGAMEDSADSADKFWESMEGGAEDAEGAIDGAGNAAKKAAKSLLSFDEVFRLNEDQEDTSGLGAGALDGIGDLAGVLGGLGSALIPEIPDLSTFANDFVNSLYNELWDSIKTIASGAGTGALIGGLVGFTIGAFVTRTLAGALTGAKWGANIGALAGGAFAGFWTDVYKEFEGSLLKIGATAAVGTLVGGLVGLVIGAFATRNVDGALAGARLGASIGTLLGGGIGAFWAGATEEMESAIEQIVVAGVSTTFAGALAGFIIGAFATRTLAGAVAGSRLGAAIGAGAGVVIGAILTECGVSLEQALSSLLSGVSAMSEGALIGGFAGMIIGAIVGSFIGGQALAGAKMGSKIGAAIGAFAGVLGLSIIGDSERTIEDRLKNVLSSVGTIAEATLIGGFAGLILGAIIGSFIGGQTLAGAKIGAKVGAAIGTAAGLVISGTVDTTERTIEDRLKNMFSSVGAMTKGTLIGGAAGLLIGAIIGAFIGGQAMAGAKLGAKVGAAIGSLVGLAIGSTLGDTEQTIGESLTKLFSDVSAMGVGSLIGGFVGMIVGAIVGAFIGGQVLPGAKIGAAIGSAVGSLGGLVYQYLEKTGITESIGEWMSGLWAACSTALIDGAEILYNHTVNIWSAYVDLFKGIVGAYVGFFTNIWEALSTLFTDIGDAIGIFFSDIWNAITTAFTGLYDTISTFFSDIWAAVEKLFSDNSEGLGGFLSDIWEALTTACVGLFDVVETFFSDIREAVSTVFADIGEAIGTFFSNIWNAITTAFSDFWGAIGQFFLDIVAALGTTIINLTSTISNFFEDMWVLVPQELKDFLAEIGQFFTDLWIDITTWFSNLWTNISTWFANTKEDVKRWWSNLWNIASWISAWDRVKQWFATLINNFISWFAGTKNKVKTWWDGLFDAKGFKDAWSAVKSWFSDLFTGIKNWFTDLGKNVKTWWNDLWTFDSTRISGNLAGALTGNVSLGGHAAGGIFDKEHIARFAEGGKAEAVIPLENASAMQPFVNAISDGILQGLLPTLVATSGGSHSDLPPMYVGTLIADEKGLEQLYRKLNIIEAKEQARKGFA